MSQSKNQKLQDAVPPPVAATAAAFGLLQPRLHLILIQHALECIFAFLSLPELSVVMRVSDRWIHAVLSMGSTGVPCTIHSAMDLDRVSRLERHIGDITVRKTTVSPAQMQLFPRRMPFLCKLYFDLAAGDWNAIRGLQLQASLRSIHMDVALLPAASINAINAVLHMISSAKQLDKLCLFGESLQSHPDMETISFAPLQSLPVLREFNFYSHQELCWSYEQTQQLAALSHIERLHVSCTHPTMLQLLQQRPRWTHFKEYEQFTDEVSALLPYLPRLHTLEIIFSSPDWPRNLLFLPHLQHLTHLICTMDNGASKVIGDTQTHADHQDTLLAGLVAPLPSVISLDIYWTYLDTSQLHTLMSHFPMLQSLVLHNAFTFDALSWLEPVQNTLETLTINMPTGVCPPTELLYLRHLPKLRELKISVDPNFHGDRELDQLQILSLTPPSSVLPSLRLFEYTSADCF